MPDQRYDAVPPAEAVAVDEAEVIRRFWDRVRLFASRRVADAAAAEDVAQETLRRVVEALRAGRVENLNALPGFVFQTALHICMQQGRSAGRAGRAMLRLQAEPRDPPPDALGALISDERRAAVLRALDGLDPPDRELLRMLYYEQLDTAEAARRLGISPGALRVRKHRVLEKLAGRMGDVTP